MTADDAPTKAQQLQDLALLTAAGAVYTLLLTVAALRPLDREGLILILYAIGGALEVVGISTVAFDLRARRQRLRRFQSSVGVVFASRTRRQMTLTPTPLFRGEPGPYIATIERNLRAQFDELDRESANRDRLFLQLIGTNDSAAAAWTGFVTLLLGVLVGTAANIISATR